MSYENLSVTRDGATALVSVRRPDVLNALNDATLVELDRVFGELDADDEYFCIDEI